MEDLSRFFGGTEITDAAGHVVLFGVLVMLWYCTLVKHLARRHALFLAVLIVVMLGTATELAQCLVPNRGVALIDILASYLGPLIVVGFLMLSDGLLAE